MTSDIVERLRWIRASSLETEAADEIERLRKERDDLLQVSSSLMTTLEAKDALLKEAGEALENAPMPGRLSWVAWRDAFRDWHAQSVLPVLSKIKDQQT